VPCDEEDKERLDAILKAQPETVSDFWKQKYEEEAGKYWDMFYKRNDDRFFKDRHYLRFVIGKEIEAKIKSGQNGSTVLLEVGCGAGNALFPILHEYPSLKCYGVDISKRAVSLVQSRSEFKTYQRRCKVWACDVAKSCLPTELEYVDVATLIFVLSAIHPTRIVQALKHVKLKMKKGAILFIRDYGVYDLSQIRFGPGSKLGENLYVRGDGTRTYFFSKEVMKQMLVDADYEVLEIIYHRKTVTNAKKDLEMKRTWIQAKARA